MASRIALRAKLRALGERVEELSDRNWELKEIEERAKSFLEAQGDVIVRHDGAAASPSSMTRFAR